MIAAVNNNPNRFGPCPLMWDGGFKMPPVSYINFLKSSSQWPPKSSSLAVVHLDYNVKKILNAVHYDVGKSIKYRKEKIDRWNIHNIKLKDINIGDCDDYAVTYQDVLIRDHGFLPTTTRLVYCRQLSGEYHLITAVDTHTGTYVLDNTASVVGPWTWFQYQWLSREHPGSFWWRGIKSPQKCKYLTSEFMLPKKAIIQHITVKD